jgi:tRNA threonylcarbamoyladenosine biosynthesis protein TsaB
MSLLLLIDSSGESGSVALSEYNRIIAFKSCNDQKEQAGFLQPAIKEILAEKGISVPELSAVAVTIGPGSYTGLRVGLATAKGLCFAAGLPLITMTTTYMMAAAARSELKQSLPAHNSYYLCPMIDARRMEVFLAVYDEDLQVIQQPAAFILDAPEMISFQENKTVFCFGNGAEKWKNMNQSNNILFENFHWDIRTLAEEAARKFKEQEFDSLEQTAPLYVKPFFTNAIVK